MTLTATLEYSKIYFLSNRCLELNDDVDVPSDVMNWAKSYSGFKHEEGYLVEFDGQYGFLFVKEHWHTGMTDPICKAWITTHPDRTPDSVLSALKRVEDGLQSSPSFNFPTLVGENTGPLECHELLVFLPSGSSDSDYYRVRSEYLRLYS